MNGAHFNVALSDIRPDDGQYAYGRAACTPADEISCFGYGPLNGIPARPSSSTFNSSNVANVIAFNVSGGHGPVFRTSRCRQRKLINVQAYPVMFFYNTLDTSAGGLGALLPKNILSHTLTGFLSGQLGLNQDLIGGATTAKTVDVVVRGPISRVPTTRRNSKSFTIVTATPQ